MSVNNIGGMNPENINPNQRRENNGLSAEQNNGTSETTVNAPASAYRQFMVNHNYNLTFEHANNNDADMHAIYEIDREAFSDLDPYEDYDDFIGFIQNNNMSVYSVKDNNGEIIGYFSLEPIKDGDLYIDSIGLKPQYRNSRKGYAAIQQAWEKINDYARENNAETMSLHVDSTNPRLKRMYEQFGFRTKESYDHYYDNGAGAHFMVREVEQNVRQEEPAITESPSEQTPEPEHTEQVPEEPVNISRGTKLKREYNERAEQVRQDLSNMDIESSNIQQSFFEKCSYEDMETGEKIFSEELYSTAKEVWDIVKDEKDEWHQNESFSKIMGALTYKDSNNVYHTQSEVIPIIWDMKQHNIRLYDFSDIIRASKTGNERGEYRINYDVLQKASEIKSWRKVSDYDIDDAINLCKMQDKDGNVHFSDSAYSKYKELVLFNGKDEYEVKNIMSACIEYDADGKQYFNTEFFKKLRDHLDDNNFDDTTGLRHSFQLKSTQLDGCKPRDYLEYASAVRRNDTIKQALRTYNDKKDVGVDSDSTGCYPDVINTAAVIAAASYETGSVKKQDYYTNTENKTVIRSFDNTAFNAITTTLQKEPMPFDNLKNLADIVNACKERPDPYSAYKFNPQIFEKSLQLKELGVNDKCITEILEACKLKDESGYYSEYSKPPVIFSNDIFNKVVEKISTRERKYYYNADIIKTSIEKRDGKEYFNPRAFDTLNDYFVSNDYNGGAGSFFITSNDGKNKFFDFDTYEMYKNKAKCRVSIISDLDRKDGENHYKPRKDKINAYAELKSKDIKYQFTGGQIEDIPAQILWACNDEFGYQDTVFRPDAYKCAIELINDGYLNGNQVQSFINSCRVYKRNPQTGYSDRIFEKARYDYGRKLMNEEGVDIENAADWAGLLNGTTIQDGVMTNKHTDKLLELYKMGVKRPLQAYWQCFDKINGEDEFNSVTYNRLKDAVSRGLPAEIISNCKDCDIFQDRLYKIATDMQDKGYSPSTINKLFELCHEEKTNPTSKEKVKSFDKNIFRHISEMEELGINKDTMPEIIQACKYNYGRQFEEKAFAKVAELKHKGFDDKGIAKFLEVILKGSYWKEEDNKTENLYNQLLAETVRHNDLKASGQDDAYLIEKISKNLSSFPAVRETFGEDIINYAVSFKTDNYVNFVSQTHNLIKNSDEQFINKLKSKLDELPSPELKAKRLRVIAGLSGKVDQNAMLPLVNMIKSPKMTEEQKQLANDIFTPEYIDENSDLTKNEKEELIKQEYEKRVNRYLDEMNTPKQYRQTVYDYLMKERLDKSIERPKSIEEQKIQMEKNAQQVLVNPKIPLDKKIAYIDEYKAKKADMERNPDKYLTPYIYQKPVTNLAKIVEAYINIPNDDIKFNNSITEAMYTQLGIETNPELLESIRYDAKFFDKLFSTPSDFRTNFKRLIELKKMTHNQPLTISRITLPEEGTEKYEKYNRLGLISQIKANLDTIRQFNEHNLDFDKWNTFNPELNGEVFSVEADPKTEFNNLRYNLINIFQDELWDKINLEERNKLIEHLNSDGFTMFNNEIFRNGKKAENSDIERFIETAVNYTSNNPYWKDGGSVNGTAPAEEIVGVSGFLDHLNGHKNRLNEIKSARTVNDIHFRLTDDNDIGRNIFFGNHVGCCNSVESTHAGYSAPMHLLNNYNRGIELVDNWGNSYGNSLCYFADVDDKLTFVIDSFEANGKLGSNPIVTDKLIEYAKQVCKEMGREDAQIMVGPNYNNMNMSKLSSTGGHTIKVVGTVSERTYCDSVGGRVKDEINRPVENRSMKVYQE